MRSIFLILISVFSLSCMQTSITSSKQKKVPNEKSDSLISNKDIDYIDFNCDCEDMMTWEGAIQGYSIPNNPLMFFGDCFGRLNYDLVLYRDTLVTLQEAKSKDSDCKVKGDIPNVSYFAFVISKHKSINPENEFDLWDYDFPSKVKVYFKTAKTQWLYKDTYEVKDFAELGKLKYKMIGM